MVWYIRRSMCSMVSRGSNGKEKSMKSCVTDEIKINKQSRRRRCIEFCPNSNKVRELEGHLECCKYEHLNIRNFGR